MRFLDRLKTHFASYRKEGKHFTIPSLADYLGQSDEELYDKPKEERTSNS